MNKTTIGILIIWITLCALCAIPKAKPCCGRVLSFATVVRRYSVETTRTEHIGDDESQYHTLQNVIAFRNAVTAGWPGASITWAFSWQALENNAENYMSIKKQVVSYIKEYQDEMTFIPGGYFAPMYNTANQTNQDIHDALNMITAIVGNNYRPKAIVAGFLSAATMKYLADEENIHVAQATIFSQFEIDYGDGDGGSPYPYYPSTQHYLKPAQSSADFIDCVALDGWTVDFLSARRAGVTSQGNSRMGVGPIETMSQIPCSNTSCVGYEEINFATAQHFNTGFLLNQEAYVTSIWEIVLVAQFGHLEKLTQWLMDTRNRYPDAKMITHGSFGMQWRESNPQGNSYDLQFVEQGSGISGSDGDKEIHWFVNPLFRLVMLRNLTDVSVGEVIDFTRYDLPAQEPQGNTFTRSWNLMNELNMKHSRPQDQPKLLSGLSTEDQQIIRKQYPQLFR